MEAVKTLRAGVDGEVFFDPSGDLVWKADYELAVLKERARFMEAVAPLSDAEWNRRIDRSWLGSHEAFEQIMFERAQNLIEPAELFIILAAIQFELSRAQNHGKTFLSAHEAYAVLLEEVEVFWEIVRQKRKDRDAGTLREELIQIAAMAVKAILSLDNMIGGNV